MSTYLGGVHFLSRHSVYIKLCDVISQGGTQVTAVVKSDFIPKPVPGSAMLTTELDKNSSSSKQLPSIAIMQRVHSVPSDPVWLRQTSSDDVDGGSSCVEKNGFSSDATAAYDELVGRRRASESSGEYSAGHALMTRRISSELPVISSAEPQKGLGSTGSRLPQRTTNQNIRMPQGIPGRDPAVRKPFINPLSSSAASASTADDTDVDTNPLRRLRDSHSGFTKPVFRPTNTQAAPPRSAEPLPPTSNNLNANLSFFDKLKEQEQLRKA